jgi:hypothetical protein
MLAAPKSMSAIRMNQGLLAHLAPAGHKPKHETVSDARHNGGWDDAVLAVVDPGRKRVGDG